MSNAQDLIDATVDFESEPFPIRFKDSTFVFWHATGGALTFMSRAAPVEGRPGAGEWRKSARLGDRTGGGVGILERTSPAAAVLGDRLYVFWHGSGRDGFFCSSTADGDHWTPPVSIRNAINGAMGIDGDADPCVAAHDGELHLFWRGIKEDETFFHCSSRDGVNWQFHGTPKTYINNMGAQRRTRPAAAVAGGKLYLLWSGSGKDGIFYATLEGGRWSQAQSLRNDIGEHGIANGASPMASQLSSGFYLLWPGSGGDGLFWVANRQGSFERAQHSVMELANLGLAPAARLVEAPSAQAEQGEPPLEIYWRKDSGADSGRLFFRTVRRNFRWMSRLRDDLSIGDLNLPGSHDAAAINRSLRLVDTDGGLNPFLWACQNMSLGEQLAAGVRVLDIRLATKLMKDSGAVEVMTCHGDISVGMGLNLFQRFDTALDEIIGFLDKNPSESVVVILKIDDEAYSTELTTKLNPFSELKYDDKDTGPKRVREEIARIIEDRKAAFYNVPAKGVLPALKDVRGKIFLLNRIGGHSAFGEKIQWPEASTASNKEELSRSTAIGRRRPDATPVTFVIQDKYKEPERKDKVAAFLSAGGEYPAADVLINYASYTRRAGMAKPVIQPEIVPKTYEADYPRVGWAMFDFVGEQARSPETGEALEATDFVIERNRKYMK